MLSFSVDTLEAVEWSKMSSCRKEQEVETFVTSVFKLSSAAAALFLNDAHRMKDL